MATRRRPQHESCSWKGRGTHTHTHTHTRAHTARVTHIEVGRMCSLSFKCQTHVWQKMSLISSVLLRQFGTFAFLLMFYTCASAMSTCSSSSPLVQRTKVCVCVCVCVCTKVRERKGDEDSQNLFSHIPCSCLYLCMRLHFTVLAYLTCLQAHLPPAPSYHPFLHPLLHPSNPLPPLGDAWEKKPAWNLSPSWNSDQHHGWLCRAPSG